MTSTFRTMSCALLLIGALATQAQAQETTGNPAVNSPKTPGADIGKPAANISNTVDEIFARQAAIGGRQEVDLAKLAGQRAQNQGVKDFAKQMVADHSKANDKVMQVAKAHGVAVPKNPDPDQQAVRAQLEKLHGAQFDMAYISSQVGDHQATVQLLEHEIGSGQDERTKALAMETLPTVMHHLEMARSLQMQLAQR
jgi:putative membrane protein